MTKKKPNKPLLSVLVPIYNVAPYLRQCLDSLIHQTLHDIEIICLNDGSTDNSLAIIKEYAKSDPRIVVVNKPNSGYGDSMNLGLKKARGKYLGIVESDDWIEPDAFEKLTNLAELHQAEVVRANYFQNLKGQDRKLRYVPLTDAARCIDPRTHTWIFYQAPAIWSAIYRIDFLRTEKVNFLPTPGASYQDTGFNFKVWSTARRACFTTAAFLHYRMDNESSSVNNPGKVMNVSTEYAEIKRFLEDRELMDDLGMIMESAKFGAYYWNLFRLSPKLALTFLPQVRSEYRAAREAGYIAREFYTPDGWRIINLWMDGTKRQNLRFIRHRKLREKLHKLHQQLLLHLRPTYAKQAKLQDYIDQLESQSDYLEEQLTLLTAKLDQTSEGDVNV